MHSITASELHALLAEQAAVPLVDVRTPAEFEQMHTVGAVNVPLDRLSADAVRAAHPLSDGQPFYLLCRSGARAEVAAAKLRSAGLTGGVSVQGGTLAWNEDDAHNMPSKRAVGQICEDLLQILFPGFHDTDAIRKETLAQLTAERMLSVIRRLQEQVRKSVRIGEPSKPTGRTAPIIKKFARAIVAVRELLKHDVQAALEGDPSTTSQDDGSWTEWGNRVRSPVER